MGVMLLLPSGGGFGVGFGFGVLSVLLIILLVIVVVHVCLNKVPYGNAWFGSWESP